MCCPVCECDLKKLNEEEQAEHVENHFVAQSDTVQCPRVECGVISSHLDPATVLYHTMVPADSLSDHLLAHNVEESDHQQLVVDSEGTKNDYGSLKNISDGIEWEGVVTKGIVEAIHNYYGSIKGCRYWLSQDTAHIHSTVEDLGWGCGYRNIQMMISCLLAHPLYSDHVMSVFLGIPTILELQKTIEKAWKEGYDPKGCAELNGKLVHTNKWIGTTEVAVLLRYMGIRAEIVDFIKPSGNHSTHPKLFNWVKAYFENAVQGSSLSAIVENGETSVCNQSNSTIGSASKYCDSVIVIDSDDSAPVAKKLKLQDDKKATKSTNGILTQLPPLYLQHQGHSRTIIGLEQSQSDSNKMFLLLLDPLKEKRDIMKIKTTSCGNAVHRYTRKSVRQETHQQYELVFINGVLSNSKEREAAKYVKLFQRFD